MMFSEPSSRTPCPEELYVSSTEWRLPRLAGIGQGGRRIMLHYPKIAKLRREDYERTLKRRRN
jgi:hypothetical protein